MLNNEKEIIMSYSIKLFETYERDSASKYGFNVFKNASKEVCQFLLFPFEIRQTSAVCATILDFALKQDVVFKI